MQNEKTTPTPEEYRIERKREKNREAQKRWRENHPARERELQRQKYQNHREQYIANQREYRRRQRELEKGIANDNEY